MVLTKQQEQENADIIDQIETIERLRQPRALREAALGIGGATDRLQTVEDEIAALREGLHYDLY